jgi:hypothetical protein
MSDETSRVDWAEQLERPCSELEWVLRPLPAPDKRIRTRLLNAASALALRLALAIRGKR